VTGTRAFFWGVAAYFGWRALRKGPSEGGPQPETRFTGIVRVRFGFDTYDLGAPQLAAIESAAETIRAANRPVRIVGHTDSVGSEIHNLELSDARAYSVALALAERGIPLDAMQWEGVGASQPIADNVSFGGRAANRRADVWWAS